MELYTNDNELWRSIRSSKSNKTIFVRPGDNEKISTFRQQASNVDLYNSACYYTSPNASAQRVHGLYFVLAERYIESARISTIETLYYLSENFGIPEGCSEVIYNGGGQVGTISSTNKDGGGDAAGNAENASYLDGMASGAGSDGCINGRAIMEDNAKDGGPAAEMIIFIQPAVFGGQLSPAVPALNYRLARQLCEDGIRNINIDVYEKNHLLPLPNCKSSAIGNYIIPLSLKELIHLDAAGIRNLAESPRAEDSLIIPRHSTEAAEWFAEELNEEEKRRRRLDGLRSLILKNGWETAACIWRLQRLCLYDNKRLETYRAVSQFYAMIGAGEKEIRRQIKEMDQRNPINDYQKLNAIVSFAIENSQFVGCGHPILNRFCPSGKCFIAELIEEYEKPYLFNDISGDRKKT